MANRYGDPRVKEYMKTHEEEVARVQKRYDELKELSLQSLLETAPESVIVKVRSLCISGIVAAEGKKR